jgi:hypothetical protein
MPNRGTGTALKGLTSVGRLLPYVSTSIERIAQNIGDQALRRDFPDEPCFTKPLECLAHGTS